ncbi:unnamed protein product [Plutella xylostella]|uniref:(diamondback moth) hypothetical protein n=1 Tax=Plutella xylostella TaxID=51655 RepID=A0A8S4GAM2_PLUXY|nr:unnamed protein product [Plutella xylostella]
MSSRGVQDGGKSPRILNDSFFDEVYSRRLSRAQASAALVPCYCAASESN